MSTVSRIRVKGARNGRPCKPSTTCGPLTPRPRMKRSPEMAAIVSAVMAVMLGVRALICMMPVPRRIWLVFAAR